MLCGSFEKIDIRETIVNRFVKFVYIVLKFCDIVLQPFLFSAKENIFFLSTKYT